MYPIDFFNFMPKSLGLASTILCLFAFHAAEAKSETPTDKTLTIGVNLILDLPADELFLKPADHGGLLQNSENVAGKQTLDKGQIIATTTKKSKPLNLGCGMDVYQNLSPDITFSNRLSGQCDLKYHY
ncbi:MAG: hypothetical protein ABSB19_13215 [Methylomonas sp.]|jgi:hypothetical protein